MYIEFTAQTTGAGFLTSHVLRMLKANIESWANINEIPYTTKLYKNTFRLAFDDNRYYTVFRLTWQDSPYTEYQLIDRQW